MIDKQTNARLKRFAQDARRYLIDQVSTKLSEVLAPDSDASTYVGLKPLYNALLNEVLGVRALGDRDLGVRDLGDRDLGVRDLGDRDLGVRDLGDRDLGFSSDGSGEAPLTPNTQPLTPNTYNLTPNTYNLTPNTYNLTPLVEQVAYTWFNRLTALRYMDLKGFNPVGIISPQTGDTLPQILSEAKMGIIDAALINPEDKERVLGLLSGTLASTYHKGDAQGEAYRILFLSACKNLGKSLPFLFKPIQDWMELLLPDDLLGEHGILAMIREVMTAEACQDVEVIGWLYQYYISEKKDEVSANVKKGKKVQSKDIPAVTQLFTPHWIVKYMVQNSLGRLWLESHPRYSLKSKMEYYVPEETESPQAEAGESIKIHSPEEIKFCDPCCGSGHILTYAFDLLFEIYSEEGYDPIAIPRLIIENNLYGIEIDERASELAAFALAMKARDKDRQWFSRGINPQICLLENIRFSPEELEPYLDRTGPDIFSYNFERMFSQFEDAKTFGSLIVPYEQDLEEVHNLLNAKDYSGDVFLAPTHKKMLKLVEQADYLSTKYQVVVTNPPYLNKGMSSELTTFLNAHSKDVKYDLFSAFVVRCSSLGLKNALIGMMNPNVWMYLSSYEKLRKWMIKEHTITNLVELPLSGFRGATVQICAYNFLNLQKSDNEGHYVRLVEFKGSDEEMAEYTKKAVSNQECGWFYRAKAPDFEKIPGSPIAYWVSDGIRNIFANSKTLDDVATPKVGLQTGDNNQFLRQWHEVRYKRIGFGMKDRAEARISGMKWFPYNKGGEFRKWYGNQDVVVNWEDDGEEIRNIFDSKGKLRSRPQNTGYYLKECVTWTFLSSSKFGVRFLDNGFLFDVAGSCAFPKTEEVRASSILAVLCSMTSYEFLKLLNPTLNFQASNIGNIPWPEVKNLEVDIIVRLAVQATKQDWDSYETSWDFQRLPLLGLSCEGLGVREAYAKLREEWIENTLKMQELEEENNRIFIEAYGLEEELSPEVPLREITLTCNPYYRYNMDAPTLPPEYQKQGPSIASPMSPEEASGCLKDVFGLSLSWYSEGMQFPLQKDLEDRLLADTMTELISYAVGCMFGRYSLDEPGLILANQGETVEDYFDKVLGVRDLGVREGGNGEADLKPKTQHLKPSFLPAKDNVIPILEGEWFADDLASRLQEFLKATFGTANYYANLSYIEQALGKDIRAYLIKDFYADHVKRYKKRPIYWLFSSPKGSFNGLIYLHRYTPDTVSILLNGYLREYIHKIRAKSQQLEHQLNAGALGEREKIFTRRQIERFQDEIVELEEWEAKVILPLAERRLQIDLDDGVKVNYAKFGKALKRF